MSFRRTATLLKFESSFKDRRGTNPLRRYVWLKAFCATAVCSTAYITGALYYATNEAGDRKQFLPWYFAEPMYLFPFNALSRTWGTYADDKYNIPSWVHTAFIKAFISAAGVNIDEVAPEYLEFDSVDAEDGSTNVTAQKFFTRRLKDGVRPVDSGASLVAPCDGQILKMGEVPTDGNNCIVQVKGCEYPVDALVRYTMKPIPKDELEDKKRMYFIIHLRPHDYHHVHAPAEFRAKQSILVPGLLLPVTNGARKCFPMLYLNNERLVVQGELLKKNAVLGGASSGKQQTVKKGSKVSSDKFGEMAMVLVGATCVGNIRLHFDHRFNTNLANPPEFALSRRYGVMPSADANPHPHTAFTSETAEQPQFKRGDDVGYFKWGSTVVLVSDCPRNSAVVPNEGDEIKMGTPLVV